MTIFRTISSWLHGEAPQGDPSNKLGPTKESIEAEKRDRGALDSMRQGTYQLHQFAEPMGRQAEQEDGAGTEEVAPDRAVFKEEKLQTFFTTIRNTGDATAKRRVFSEIMSNLDLLTNAVATGSIPRSREMPLEAMDIAEIRDALIAAFPELK